MAKPARTRAMRNLKSAGWSAAKITGKTTGRATEKAATGLFRWMTTDHTGTSEALANMPLMGFLDTIKYILFYIFCGLLSAVLTGAIAFLLIAYGIPMFFEIMFDNGCETYIC